MFLPKRREKGQISLQVYACITVRIFQFVKIGYEGLPLDRRFRESALEIFGLDRRGKF